MKNTAMKTMETMNTSEVIRAPRQAGSESDLDAQASVNKASAKWLHR